MKKQADDWMRIGASGVIGLVLLLWTSGLSAADKAEKTFQMAVTDQQGVETELKNVIFYWEEKMSETSFVPHELRHLPAKRGTAIVNMILAFHFTANKGDEKKADNTAKAFEAITAAANAGGAQPEADVILQTGETAKAQESAE